MVKIKKQPVSNDVINKRSYGYGNPVNSITIHQTGNTNKGANAQAHANLQSKGNTRNASWHYQVDDKQVIQSFPDEIKCWHATDGKGPGNTTSISIEICINSDGDYEKAIKNAAELVQAKLKEHNLTIKDVKQHNHWHSKNCPAQLRAGYKGITWSDFLNMVEGDKVVEAPKTQVKSETISKSKANLKVDGYWGPATTKALQRYFNTTVDGVISGQPVNQSTKNIPSVKYGTGGSNVVKAMQKWLGTLQDRYISEPSLMIKALQKRFGTPQDGIISKPSLVVKELQRRLNKGKL